MAERIPLTDIARDIEGVGSLPLTRAGQTRKPENASVLHDSAPYQISFRPAPSTRSREGSQLTKQEVTSPITVIGVWANKEQEHDLDGEEDTVEIQDHGGYW